MMKICNMDMSSTDYLFKPAFRSHGISKLIYKNQNLSYTATRENMVSKLKQASSGLNLGLHCLKSGGATTAVALSVNERCIKRHGRWKCESSKDMYIVNRLKNCLSVSKKLGL